MAETTYTSVVWTAGDTITEAKLDNMVANDRAVDAMAQGIEFVERADPSTPGANKVHLYAKDKNGVPTLYSINDAGTIQEIRPSKPAFMFSSLGGVATGTDAFPTLPSPFDLTITKVYGIVTVAPDGADIIVDIRKNGTSIWASTPANRLTISDGLAVGTQTSFDTTAITEDDLMSVNVIQVGSTTPGTGLALYVKCK